MRVLDVMTHNPVTVQRDAPLSRALELMDEHDIRHLVVASGGILEGLISERDLLAATGWIVEPSDPRRVADVMVRYPTITDPTEELLTAAMTMLLDSIGCLPVVEQGRVVGIVTDTDLARAYVMAAERGLLEGEFDPAIETRMTRDPITASPSDSVMEARLTMRARRIRHLPVVDSGRLLGVLTERDARRVEGRHRLRESVLHEALRKRLVTVEPATRATFAASLMLEHRIGCLPVVADGQLVGIFTTGDLLDLAANTLWKPERMLPPQRKHEILREAQ